MKRKVTIKNIFGYSCLNFVYGATTLISAWLMYFYTAVCGISPIKAGLIFSLARLIDAVGNPVMGFISDNFGQTVLGKKFGRRKFFILIGVPIIFMVYPLLWISGRTFSYYLLMNLIFEMVYTMIVVPATTLPAEMTQDAGDKAKLVGAKQYMGTLACTIALFIPGRMFVMYGKNSPRAFFLTGLIYGTMNALAIAIVYFLTFERDPKDIKYEKKAGSISEVFKKIFIDVSSSMRIKAFRNHCVMMALGGIFKNLAGGVFTYFVVYVLMLSTVITSNISSFTTLVSSIALLVYIVLGYKYGGPKTFRISTVIVFISLFGFYALTFMKGSSSLVLLLVIFSVLSTAGKAGIDYIPTFQLAFIADIDEAVTGERREGIFNGVNSLLSKVASSIEAAVLGIGLGAFGFKSGVKVQSAGAIHGIIFVTVILPFILLGISWVASLGLKLKKENHKVLVDEVNRLKAGGDMKDAAPEARKAFKDLTGFDYEKCWGNNNVGYGSRDKAITNSTN